MDVDEMSDQAADRMLAALKPTRIEWLLERAAHRLHRAGDRLDLVRQVLQMLRVERDRRNEGSRP